MAIVLAWFKMNLAEFLPSPRLNFFQWVVTKAGQLAGSLDPLLLIAIVIGGAKDRRKKKIWRGSLKSSSSMK